MLPCITVLENQNTFGDKIQLSNFEAFQTLNLNISRFDGPKSEIFGKQSYFRPRDRILEEFWSSKNFIFFTFVHYPRKCLLIIYLFCRVRIRGQQHVEANYKANVPNSTWKSTKNWCYVPEQKTCSSKLIFQEICNSQFFRFSNL